MTETIVSILHASKILWKTTHRYTQYLRRALKSTNFQEKIIKIKDQVAQKLPDFATSKDSSPLTVAEAAG